MVSILSATELDTHTWPVVKCCTVNCYYYSNINELHKCLKCVLKIRMFKLGLLCDDRTHLHMLEFGLVIAIDKLSLKQQWVDSVVPSTGCDQKCVGLVPVYTGVLSSDTVHCVQYSVENRDSDISRPWKVRTSHRKQLKTETGTPQLSGVWYTHCLVTTTTTLLSCHCQFPTNFLKTWQSCVNASESEIRES